MYVFADFAVSDLHNITQTAHFGTLWHLLFPFEGIFETWRSFLWSRIDFMWEIQGSQKCPTSRIFGQIWGFDDHFCEKLGKLHIIWFVGC